MCEKDYTWNPATCTCGNGKYLRSITDDVVLKCYSVSTNDSVSTNVLTNAMCTVWTGVTSFAPMNFHDKKVR